MDVRCEKCGSEYELDESKVTPQGVSVKCTSCGNVFRVTKPAVSRAPATGDWIIRQQNGQMFKFKELTTLQRWIVERRVTREDEISKTGDTWKRLGDIVELTSFFQVAEQAANVPPTAITADPVRQQIATIDEQDEPGGRKKSSTAVLLAVSLIGVAVIVSAFFARHELADLVRGGPQKPAVNPTAELADGHVRAGLKELHKDTFVAFAAAEREFEKALSLNPALAHALAGATVTLAAWAEYSREEAQDIDAEVKAAGAGKVTMTPAALAQMAGTLATKQADAATRTERAFAYMKRALETDPGGELSIKAAARYYALTNAQEAFKAIADTAQQKGIAEDAEFVYALGLLRAADDSARESAAALFQRVLEKDPDHVGARYHLAVLAYKRNDSARALGLLAEVLRASPDHSRALALKQKIEPPKVEAPTAPTAAPAAAPESFEVLMGKAKRALQGERIKQAVDLYERALVLRPDNAEALAGLGFCYLDLDQTQNAISQFQKALTSNSRFPEAHMGIAEAYKERGLKRDAVKHYKRYLELTPNGSEAGVAQKALQELGQD